MNPLEQIIKLNNDAVVNASKRAKAALRALKQAGKPFVARRVTLDGRLIRRTAHTVFQCAESGIVGF
jgi:hypothetical protein